MGGSAHTKSETDTDFLHWFLLLLLGRRPATRSLSLSCAGVNVDSEGKVLVDEADRTSAPNIYAIGDVAQVSNFT